MRRSVLVIHFTSPPLVDGGSGVFEPGLLPVMKSIAFQIAIIKAAIKMVKTSEVAALRSVLVPVAIAW